MIRMYDQVPLVYNNASRDFQFLSHLIDIVLNSVKHNVDGLYSLPNSKASPELTELLAMTLGFKIRRNYNMDQLIAIVEILPIILKYKGTLYAVNIAGEALIRASGAVGRFKCELASDSILHITFPQDSRSTIDITLFTDLLPYILPAGVTCRIFRKTEIAQSRTVYFDLHNTLYATWHPDVKHDKETDGINGLASLYSVNKDSEGKVINPVFANFRLNADGKTYSVSEGLLSNNVIPILDGPITPEEENDTTAQEEND